MNHGWHGMDDYFGTSLSLDGVWTGVVNHNGVRF